MTESNVTRDNRLAWYATILLTVTYTFSFIDRQIVNLLVEPIQADLLLSDTQISFLQGLAFVVPYLLFSVPIGRVVDTFSRIKVLIGGIIFWSVACIYCGLSKNVIQLTIGRMGVGAGEASVTPAAWSSLRLSRCIRVFPMKQLIRGGRLSAVSTRFTIVPMGSPIGASPRFPGPTICYWTMERNTWRDCEAEAMRRIRSEMRRRSLRWFLHFPRTPGSTHQMYLSDVGRSV